MEMNNPAVRIVPDYTPRPTTAANYELLCRSASHPVRVTVTSKPSAVRKWVKSTLHYKRNQFRRGRLVVGVGLRSTDRGAVATIQLCAGHNCLIFQLLHGAVFPIAVLNKFLSNPDITFAGLESYTEVLDLLPVDLAAPAVVDLRRVANSERDCSLNASMEMLASQILGWDGMVMAELNDWDDEWLNEEQVKCASLDAFLSHLIAKNLKVWEYSAH